MSLDTWMKILCYSVKISNAHYKTSYSHTENQYEFSGFLSRYYKIHLHKNILYPISTVLIMWKKKIPSGTLNAFPGEHL